MISRSDPELDKLHERAFEYRDKQLKLPENSNRQLEVVMGYQGLVQEL